MRNGYIAQLAPTHSLQWYVVVINKLADETKKEKKRKKKTVFETIAVTFNRNKISVTPFGKSTIQ